MDPTTPGPDLAVVGAARSGTSLLAAHLAAHPKIDASAVKEPNYFSRHFDRGVAWYEGYFGPREEGVNRLDASVSYTFPQFPEAIARLVQASPCVFVVYVVREPIPRAVSHYQYYKHYFAHEAATDFAAALRSDSYYADVSDYRRWLDALSAALPPEQLLVVPFAAVTQSSHAVAEVICSRLGLSAPPDAEAEASSHQNNVVTFRSDWMRRLTKALRHSRVYPTVRRVLGANRLRRIRSAVTEAPDVPTFEESLASCDQAQLAELETLRISAETAVAEWLTDQDQRLGLDWAAQWPQGAIHS
jgi:hypothetical protein